MSLPYGRLKSIGKSAALLLPSLVRKSSRLILSYHNIVPDGTGPVGDTPLHLPISRFREQLALIARSFDVVSLEALVARKQGEKPCVALTFDDAYLGAVTLGAAACRELSVPATVFVSPMLLGRIPIWDVLAEQGRWSGGERAHFLTHRRGISEHAPASALSLGETLRIATLDELEGALSLGGITIGNHTLNHANLAALSESEALHEVVSAQEWLMDHFGSRCRPILSLPYGSVHRDTESIGRRAGLQFALKVEGGWIHDKADFVLPRWNVPAFIDRASYRLRLRGYLCN
jgi:peptidoglycan/xylan/chitin deacetylase (PgdA/CDA1 family)